MRPKHLGDNTSVWASAGKSYELGRVSNCFLGVLEFEVVQVRPDRRQHASFFLVGAREGSKMTGNSNVAKTGKAPYDVDTLQEGTPAAVQRTITQVRPAVALCLRE